MTSTTKRDQTGIPKSKDDEGINYFWDDRHHFVIDYDSKKWEMQIIMDDKVIFRRVNF